MYIYKKIPNEIVKQLETVNLILDFERRNFNDNNSI